jgi:hypothetical protein
VIEVLSEPETGRPADNLMTNEDSFPRVCGELARRAPAGGVYVGVGPDQNLTYLAHARVELGFVVDYRRRNLRLHLLHRALLALAADRAGYLSRLTARSLRDVGKETDGAGLVAAARRAAWDQKQFDREVREVRRYLEPLRIVQEEEWSDLRTIHARLSGPGVEARFLALPMYPTLGDLITTTDREGRPAHFLAAEGLYATLRSLQCEDRVIPLVGDLGSPGTLGRIGAWLRERSLGVSVVYLSDVEFFLLRGGRYEGLVQGLEALPRLEGAVLLRTSTREIRHPQRVKGDSSTTIVVSLQEAISAWRGGKVRGADDLFAAP